MDYPTLSTIEDGFAINKYKEGSFAYELLEEVTSKFLELIQTNTEVVTYADEMNENYRYWKCMDCIIPCGGIHGSFLNEIGSVFVETKYKKKEITIKIILR